MDMVKRTMDAQVQQEDLATGDRYGAAPDCDPVTAGPALGHANQRSPAKRPSRCPGAAPPRPGSAAPSLSNPPLGGSSRLWRASRSRDLPSRATGKSSTARRSHPVRRLLPISTLDRSASCL